eukprot:CAMPEP_0178415684 /NCGR_PEP_ID=MMETSP0689_2-20121128/23677_1 /TAXON_ID=160604 /ORGANISM="Amphidinium massartii, Strain CS-259" /LENGTH=233 /DNA_ID=CAMNT_0020037009 /DNA_START=107 /DNA_END=805 /DNA_ORIENTATION=+
MTVMVMTARTDPKISRDVSRRQWKKVSEPNGHVCMRFAVCKSDDMHEAALQVEHDQMGDLIFLDCVEGYAHGALTRKLVAAMEAYSAGADDPCMNRDLFMKVDDDTFVQRERFWSSINSAWQQHGDAIFVGVHVGGGKPVRDPRSRWYEPLSAWPQERYPVSMYGGPGYVLGRSLVQQTISSGIARNHLLWNEDRAVGVWMSQLQQQGVHVNFVNLPGTNGFSWDPQYSVGAW